MVLPWVLYEVGVRWWLRLPLSVGVSGPDVHDGSVTKLAFGADRWLGS